ncbi:hypothetical protein NQL31_005929 [Lotmaria passim]
MPSKKKVIGSAAKEELPDPATVKNGSSTTYIGGWSSFETVESITEVSEQVMEAHTGPDGVVAALPRTNVFLLPSSACATDDAVQPLTVVVVDQMNIEGVSRQQCGRANGAVKTWARSADPAVTASSNADAPGNEQRPTSGESGGKGGEATAQEPVNPFEDALHDVRYSQTVVVGASYAARDVVVSGSCSIEGMPPKIVVPPQLPSKPDLDAVTLDEPEAAATAANDAAGKPKKSSSAAKSAARNAKKGKAKLTPEQVEELERKKAAVNAEYLQQTEQAMQQAQEQADYLMTFAHPDRWPHVFFRHVTFAGPVVVSRAHVTFQNCCFTATLAERPQLLVSQYCRVGCIKCTFEAPQRCGVYALPSAQVTVRKCLFTGAAQTAWWAASVPGLSLQAGGVVADINANEVGGEAAPEDGEAAAPDAADGGSAIPGKNGTGGLASPIALAGEVKDIVDNALQKRSAAVGIQTDSAKLHAQACGFVALGIGVYVRGSYSVYLSHCTVTMKSAQQLTADACDVVMEANAFHHFANTAILLDKTARLVGLWRNFVEACAYYGLDCHGGSKSVLVRGNLFSANAVVRIREGASVTLFHNDFQSIPLNDNVYENPCLQPVY